MNDFITVSELNNYIEGILKNDRFLRNFWVKGEISGFRLYRQSGHMYFTLKDENGQVSCVMFKSRNRNLDFDPEDGQEVLLRGYVSLFSQQGKYQVYVEEIQPYGLGGLFLYLEQLKARLAEAGYFNLDKKKPIPTIVNQVGIVTSQDGAAFHDIVRVLKARHSGVEIVLAHSTVQGEGAPREIAKAIQMLNEYGQVEVIIIGRGGGSLEDLMAFNSEEVVKAIYDSHIPIISAVGHEVDFSLADLAADIRAATPTQAAQLAVPEIVLIENSIDDYQERLRISIKRYLEYRSEQIDSIMMRNVWQNPLLLVEQRQERLLQIETNLEKAIINDIDKKTNQFSALLSTLDALSPLKVIQRGYSLLRQKNKIIRSIEDINIGDEAVVEVSDGYFDIVINNKEKDNLWKI
ncbi:MAG TPA: exodeoxyribonuclease VII large subunit [Syntrophomonadaceae bacterium]|nr:exodeoxyribonuclease VII large subunit [Syntrophomonadaceae bacterium]